MTLLLLALGCARSFHDARSYPCPEDGGATFAASGPLTFSDAGPGEDCAIHAASATFPKRDEATYTRITAVELFGLPSYDLSWESQPDVADATLISIDWAPSAEAEADLREVVRVTAPREGSGTLDWDAATTTLELTCDSCTVEIHGIGYATVTLLGPTSFATLCSVADGEVKVEGGLAIVHDSPEVDEGVSESPEGFLRTSSEAGQRPLACLR